MAKILH